MSVCVCVCSLCNLLFCFFFMWQAMCYSQDGVMRDDSRGGVEKPQGLQMTKSHVCIIAPPFRATI